MRYGYFLAHDGTEHGEPEIAAACRQRWGTVSLEKPLPFDGVSAWFGEDGRLQVRMFCRDFFGDATKPVRVVQVMIVDGWG